MMEEEGEEPLLELGSRTTGDGDGDGDGDGGNKGGFRTLPFIIGADGLEKMATFGVTPNMTVYLIGNYYMGITAVSNVMFLWSSATNFMPIVWAIVSDSFLGQFYTIGFGSTICFLGLILLWATTIIPYAKPPPSDESSTHFCSLMVPQFVFLCSALGLISIGSGGVRSSSSAFGVNQLRKGNLKKTSCVKDSYFSWYYVSYTFSVLVAYTCVVYIQDNLGWRVGFAVPALLMLLAVFLFFSASLWYIKPDSKTSLVTDMVKVVVASYRNRHFKLSHRTDVVYHHNHGSSNSPSRKLRFLNKACIVEDPHYGTMANGVASNSWNLCTVDQVEEFKSLLRVLPIWASGMIMYVNICQTSFPILQAASMNRKISSFEFPAASFPTFTALSVIVWVILYDRMFLPLASRVRGRRVRISSKTRMGFGIFLSFISMLVTAAVESIRRAVPAANMSAIWLLPQYCLTGFAEASNVIAQSEFYFSELPSSMWSIAASLNGIGLAVANLVASVILNSIDMLSIEGGGQESWISNDIDKGHYDYYYLILAGLSMANMVYFLVCSSAYGPLKGERNLAEEETNP